MLTRIRAIMKKEYRQIQRDKRTLAVLIFLPMFLLGIFGYAVNFDVHHIRLAIVDEDLSEESRRLIQSLSTYDYFNPVISLESRSDIDTLINREHIQAALVIPADFARQLHRGDKASVQCIVDGVNGNIGLTASGYMARIIGDYSSQLQMETIARHGLQKRQILDSHERIWFNPELKSTNFLVPGLISFILMITAVISTAMSVVREIELNTIEQIIVSPVRSYELMIGKAVPFMIIALASGSLILVAAWILFGITVKGSLLTLLLASILFLLGALGQGLFISTVARSQAVAFTMAILSSLIPTLLLSGFVFPLKSMPIALQAISYIVPARYFLVILRGVILKGTGIALYYEQFLFLFLFTTLMIAVSSRKMSRVM